MFNNMDLNKELIRVNNLFTRFGQPTEVCWEENGEQKTKSCKCFIMPLRYKNKIYLEGIVEKIGYVDERHYLFLGPPSCQLTGLPLHTVVKSGEKEYSVKTAETVRVGGKVAYEWAVLQTVHEEDSEWHI